MSGYKALQQQGLLSSIDAKLYIEEYGLHDYLVIGSSHTVDNYDLQMSPWSRETQLRMKRLPKSLVG
jgi:hypothetical protein